MVASILDPAGGWLFPLFDSRFSIVQYKNALHFPFLCRATGETSKCQGMNGFTPLIFRFQIVLIQTL